MSGDAGAVRPLVFRCGGSAMLGMLHAAVGDEPEVAVLVIVGGPQYRVGSHRQFVATARALAAAGYPVLRFDYRGMGDSEGTFIGFEGIADDIHSAIDALVETCRPRRGVVLLGLCDAASAALMYCGSDPRVAGLILMNPWVRSEQTQAAVVVKRYYLARLLQADFWRKLVSGRFDFAGSARSLAGNLRRAAKRPQVSRRGGFIEAMRSGLLNFTGPVLVVQSGRDLTADEFRARCAGDPEWQRGLSRGDVEVFDMAEADHTFSRARDLGQFNDHLKEWLVRLFGNARCR